MLLTNSSSKAMIRENFVRYWPIPVLTLLTYIVVGMLPVMLNYREFDQVSYYAANFISGIGIVPNFVIAISAVIASAAVFGYLHDPVSANAIHAMPANRKKLFASAAFSGWLFVMIPVVIMAFLFLLMRGATLSPTFNVQDYDVTSWGNYAGTAKEIFTIGHSFIFIISCAITATFVFAICCLAAVLSGKKIIHVLLALFLIGLPTCIMLQIDGILGRYLYGFRGLNIDYSWLSALNYALQRDHYKLEAVFIVYYLLIAAVLFVVSYLIYKKVKLERIGSACTFPIVADVLCIIFTFMVGIGLAELIILFAGDSGNVKARFVITSIITSVIVYLVMRMIADSTPAVFNLATLKKFCVYLAILAVFMAFAVGDVTGFQKRIPDASEVESVTFSTNFPEDLNGTAKRYSDPGMIDAVHDLQSAIIDTRNVDINELPAGESIYTYGVTITWNLKNGTTVSRQYEERFGRGFETVEAAAKEVYEQDSFKAGLAAEMSAWFDVAKAVRVYGWDDFNYDEEVRIETIRKEDRAEFMEALLKDYEARSFEQVREGPGGICVEIEAESLPIPTTTNQTETEGSSSSDSTVNPFESVEVTEIEILYGDAHNYYIKSFDKNSIAFLKEKGYYDEIRATF